MIKKLKRFIPLLIVGLFLVHVSLWYGLSFYFERQLEKVLTTLAAQDIQISYSVPDTGGYPARFQHHLHDVRLKVKNQWTCTIPVLSIEANFLFPVTKKLKVHLEGVTMLSPKNDAYKVALTNLHGVFSLSPLALHLSTHAASLLMNGIPFGEGKETALSFEKEKSDQIRLRLSTDLMFWFSNPLAPSLPFHFFVNCRLSPAEAFWKPALLSQQQIASLYLDAFKVQMMGTSLQGKGTLMQSPDISWNGELHLRLQGITQFSRFLEDFVGVRTGTLINLMSHFSRSFKKDTEGAFDFSCHLKEGNLYFKEIPFIHIPLFGERAGS